MDKPMCEFTGNPVEDRLYGVDRWWRSACFQALHDAEPTATRQELAEYLGTTKAVALHALHRPNISHRCLRYLSAPLTSEGERWRMTCLGILLDIRVQRGRPSIRVFREMVRDMFPRFWDGMRKADVKRVYNGIFDFA